jgi:hypothetical protein
MKERSRELFFGSFSPGLRSADIHFWNDQELQRKSEFPARLERRLNS